MSVSNSQNNNVDYNYRLKAGLFLTGVSGLAAALGFGATLAAARRRDAKMFEKGVNQLSDQVTYEGGLELALRALKWATVYSVSGTSLIAYGIWKLSGASNFEEFRQKMGSILPKIPKNEVPQGRTEFSGLTDLMRYLSEGYQNDTKRT